MRNDFQEQLDQLMDGLVGMAEVADRMLDDAMQALADQSEEAADDVIRRDGIVDDAYERIQQGVLRLIALQAPVASDLRLLAAMLHVNIHIERMGDYATSVAKMVKRAAGFRDEPELGSQLVEMGGIARQVGREAIRSFVQRDVEAARRLPALDDGVDQLNIGLFHRLVRLAADDELRLEWATRMIVVARLVERYGDHAVDIGEQTIFAVTGSTVELSSNAPG